MHWVSGWEWSFLVAFHAELMVWPIDLQIECKLVCLLFQEQLFPMHYCCLSWRKRRQGRIKQLSTYLLVFLSNVYFCYSYHLRHLLFNTDEFSTYHRQVQKLVFPSRRLLFLNYAGVRTIYGTWTNARVKHTALHTLFYYSRQEFTTKAVFSLFKHIVHATVSFTHDKTKSHLPSLELLWTTLVISF